MGKQALEQFLAKIQQDAGLRSELKKRFGTPENGISLMQITEFAASKGYQFTAEEVEGELSEVELEGVSGGGSYFLSRKAFPKVEGHNIASMTGDKRLFIKWD